MKMPNLWKTLLAASVLSLSFSAPSFAADDATKTTKRSAEAREERTTDQAKADYEAAKERCKELKGNEKDVCMKEAKAGYKTAKSQAKAERKATDARAEANADSREAGYKAAKERCDALSGAEKDACQRDAKAKYQQ